MKSLATALINCIILVVSLVIHRIIIRFLNLPVDNSLVYWGSLIVIFGIINLVVVLVIAPRK